VLLLDGHNVIGRVPGLSLEREEEAREQLLRRVAAVKGSGGRRVIVVFDGNRPGAAKESAFGGIRVVFSPQGRTADEEILRRVGQGRPAEVTVVTSDRVLADRVRSLGARVETAEAFLARLRPRTRGRADTTSEVTVSPEEVEAWLQAFRGEHKI
jgi:uncharacterized protein